MIMNAKAYRFENPELFLFTVDVTIRADFYEHLEANGSLLSPKRDTNLIEDVVLVNWLPTEEPLGDFENETDNPYYLTPHEVAAEMLGLYVEIGEELHLSITREELLSELLEEQRLMAENYRAKHEVEFYLDNKFRLTFPEEIYHVAS